MRLLVLEDDPDTRDALVASLKVLGYAVDEASDATEAGGLARTYPYDVLLVDVNLPEGATAGVRLVRALREEDVRAPVLFISGRAELKDRVAGLDAGGDDYVVKPFEFAEVAARVRALLRRPRQGRVKVLERGPLRVDWNERTVHLRGEPVHLTAKEYAVLELLALNPGRIYSREEVVQHVNSVDSGADAHVVDVHIWRLRKKLGAQTVATVRGLGYHFPAR